MLQEFTVDNFKSLINLTFRPRQVNVLLGVNNAGKTNLCLAMRFLSATTRRSLDECAESAAGGRSAVTNYYLSKDTVDFRVKASLPFPDDTLSFDYSLTVLVKKPRGSDSYLEVQSELLRVTGQGFDRVTLLENSPDGAKLLNEVERARGHATYVEASPPGGKTMLNLLYDVKAHARLNCFRDYLHSWRYYALSPLAMRGSRQRRNQPLLQTDGRNLASVVYRLKTTDERRYRELVERLQSIEPSIDVINFDVPSERRVFMTFEDEQGNHVPAGNASSGTLRYLAMLYILLGQPAVLTSPLVIIEEPENGIYVGLLKELVRMASQQSPRSQLIFTSHSPYFIDLFDSRLDSIFVMKPGEQHSSITQPDVAQVKKRLEKYPLGEQHFREMLG